MSIKVEKSLAGRGSTRKVEWAATKGRAVKEERGLLVAERAGRTSGAERARNRCGNLCEVIAWSAGCALGCWMTKSQPRCCCSGPRATQRLLASRRPQCRDLRPPDSRLRRRPPAICDCVAPGLTRCAGGSAGPLAARAHHQLQLRLLLARPATAAPISLNFPSTVVSILRLHSAMYRRRACVYLCCAPARLPCSH